MTPDPIRVLIVDDSALVRKVVTDSLKPFPDITVVGTAVDPYIARDKILQLNPDVLTLDIEMPRMDGLSFLKLLMQHRPMPVIIISSLTEAGSQQTLEALHYGAVDVLPKPSGTFSAVEDGRLLADKIRAAAMSRFRRTPPPAPARLAIAKKVSVATHEPGEPRALILLGASTGGTEALKDVLTTMSPDLPGICIVQHIPAYFSRAFAERLDQCCAMEVREAAHGDVVRPGLALVAPGGLHMILKWRATRYVVELSAGPAVHHQRPAVDILFDSAVRAGAGPHTSAALLTGMGADGAAGLLKLRQAGAQTIAQDEDTCVVFGMPREAIRMDAAQYILPLHRIGARLEHMYRLSHTPTALQP